MSSLDRLIDMARSQGHRVTGWYTLTGGEWKIDHASPGHYTHRTGNPGPLQPGDLCQSVADTRHMIYLDETRRVVNVNHAIRETLDVTIWRFLMGDTLRALVLSQSGSPESMTARWFVNVVQRVDGGTDE